MKLWIVNLFRRGVKFESMAFHTKVEADRWIADHSFETTIQEVFAI